MPRPEGPQWDAHTLELMNAAKRRVEEVSKNKGPMKFGSSEGRKGGSPVGPLDADIIDRASNANRELSDYGYTMKDIGSRGFSVDIGDPDVLVTGTPHSEGGFTVNVSHADRFRTDEQGNFVYPEGWGDVSKHLPVAKEQLPGALMDFLTSSEARKHIEKPR